ncbi:MAG: hypothetical protein HOU01_18265 [Streptomycetaceae bacterium]|nr:hypothetical protein [Streptomycetaceae bacterium]
MPDTLLITCRITTVLAWVVAALDVLPVGPVDLTSDALLLVVAAACVGSYAWISRAHARPYTEVYLAAKEVGRREALAELECGKVTRMPERRLRAVDRA